MPRLGLRILLRFANFASGSSRSHVGIVSVGVQKGSISNVFTFDSPSIVRMTSAANGPITGQFQVSMAGRSFASRDVSPRCRFVTFCSGTVWISDSLLYSRLRRGSGYNLAVEVLTSANFSMAVSFNVPALAAVTNGSVAPASGSFSVTVVGSNFATVDRSVKTRVSASSALSSRWICSFCEINCWCWILAQFGCHCTAASRFSLCENVV